LLSGRYAKTKPGTPCILILLKLLLSNIIFLPRKYTDENVV